MVVIEPEPVEDEKPRVTPEQAAESDGGDASDGFETASETDFDGDGEEKLNLQQAAQSSSSVLPGDDKSREPTAKRNEKLLT